MKADKARCLESLMTEERLDTLWEMYYCADECLGPGRGALRERLREALGWLEKCRPLCGLKPENRFERQVTKDLTRFLEAAGRLEALTEKELVGLADDVRRVRLAVVEAFEQRVAALHEQGLG
jgi:hypothetical protein